MVIALTGLMKQREKYCGGLPRHAQGFRAALKFHRGLKEMMRALGLTDDEIEGVRKEIPCERLNGAHHDMRCRPSGQNGAYAHGTGLLGEPVGAEGAPVGVWHTHIVIDDCRFPE